MRSSGYGGCEVAVGTRHGKERQLAPAFADVLGARLVVPPDLDTDRFGTFSAEVTRTLSAVEAVRAKARLGMRAANLPYGLASEASYGPLPGHGLFGHEELLLFVDDVRSFEVLEGYRTDASLAFSQRVRAVTELSPSVIHSLDRQGLVVGPAAGGSPADIVKGIADEQTACAAIAAATGRSSDGFALVQADLRAHHNASRQEILIRLAQRMAHRLSTRCPRCRATGFGRVRALNGRPCRICATPTALAMGEVHACAVCGHGILIPSRAGKADPSACPTCNP